MRLRLALWPDCPVGKHRIEMEQLVVSEGIVLFAELEAGESIGFAEVSIRHEHVPGVSSCPVPYLEAWYVEESSRRGGVGRALLAAVEAWARNRGFIELASDTDIANERSIAAHERLGFCEVGRAVQFVKRID